MFSCRTTFSENVGGDKNAQMAAFKDHCVFFWAASIVLVLLAFVHQSEAANFTVEVTVVHMVVDGTTSLPDPGPLNAFLGQNKSLFNPLLPAPHPPLQLQRCNSTIYQINAFDFYTLQHPGGCGSAPGLVNDPKQERLMNKYDEIVLIWAIVVLGLLDIFLIWPLVSKQTAKGTFDFLGKALFPPRRPAGNPHFDQTWLDGCLVFEVITWLGCAASIILAFAIYTTYIDVKYLVPAELPDTVSLNHFLSTSNQTATLYRCTIRDVFQVYVGFADSCDQLESCIYPGVVRKRGPPPSAHGAGMSFLMIVASITTYASCVLILMGTLYCCCCCGHISKSVRKELRERKQVQSVEMQDANGSAV